VAILVGLEGFIFSLTTTLEWQPSAYSAEKEKKHGPAVAKGSPSQRPPAAPNSKVGILTASSEEEKTEDLEEGIIRPIKHFDVRVQPRWDLA
jgi:hypothetical protein